ncbi:hypothetical protein [Desulforhopalus singaporensis]|uniref:hypothetical protein n=1 Tax=Desulforhopalus singaporensis TaxID=91360 RepID=UPI000B886807|nr:hypothetical protein [Desulforhopalus singaporensis]
MKYLFFSAVCFALFALLVYQVRNDLVRSGQLRGIVIIVDTHQSGPGPGAVPASLAGLINRLKTRGYVIGATPGTATFPAAAPIEPVADTEVGPLLFIAKKQKDNTPFLLFCSPPSSGGSAMKEFDRWFDSLWNLYRSGGLYRNSFLAVIKDSQTPWSDRLLINRPVTGPFRKDDPPQGDWLVWLPPHISRDNSWSAERTVSWHDITDTLLALFDVETDAAGN